MAIVLRENGRFEVYADFILVNEYINLSLQCVDIETDLNHFYFKFVKDAEKVSTDKDDLEIQIRRVPHYWRNRISFMTSVEVGTLEKWNWVLHRRISKFFRLYTQINNFSLYVLVSHRNMISVYEMKTSFRELNDLRTSQ